MRIYVCLLLLVTICTCAKLPPNFPRCKKSDENFKGCLGNALFESLRQLDKPAKEIGLPTLDPLEIPAMTIGAGTGPVALVQNFKDVKIYGLPHPIEGSTKFEIDFDQGVANMEATFPELKILANYDINGKILLLPVYGKGPATIILENVLAAATVNFEEKEKNGKKYLKVTKTKLILKPKLMKFTFENLFDGDKALGDNINKVLNENWQDVWEDVKSGYEEAIGTIIESLVNNVVDRVPESNLF